MDNMGGAVKLWAIPQPVVTSIASGVLSLSSEDDVIEIYFTAETLKLDHEFVNSKNDKAGGFHNNRITAFVPKISEDTEEQLDYLRGRDFVVLLLDSNYQYMAIGNTTNALHFSYTSSTGADSAELNGYNIVFEGKTRSAPAYNIAYPFSE